MRIFEDIFFSGTHGGETLALAAARELLDTIADGTVLADIEAKGMALRAALQAAVAGHGLTGRITVTGEPQRAVVGFTGEPRAVDQEPRTADHAGRRVPVQRVDVHLCPPHAPGAGGRPGPPASACATVTAAGDDVAARLRGKPVEPVFRAP